MNVLSRHAGLRFFRFFSRPLQPAELMDPPEGLQLRFLSEREVLEWCADPALDLSKQNVSEAFARGDLCVGTFDGNQLVGCCWFAFSPVHHLDGVWVGFHSEAVWTYKSFVRPAYRGRRVAPKLYRLADEASARRGRRFSIICIESHNLPSIAAARRAGYASAGYAAYVLLLGNLFACYSPGAKRDAIRFHCVGVGDNAFAPTNARSGR